MRHTDRLPKRIPPGSKYVLESQAGFVHRFIELPNGRRLKLATRKAPSCDCFSTSIVPATAETARTAPRRTRVLARA